MALTMSNKMIKVRTTMCHSCGWVIVGHEVDICDNCGNQDDIERYDTVYPANEIDLGISVSKIIDSRIKQG